MLGDLHVDRFRGSADRAVELRTWQVEIPGCGTVADIVNAGVAVEHVKAAGRALQSEIARMNIKLAPPPSVPQPPNVKTSPALEPITGEATRRINAWLTERPKGLTPPLVLGERYQLNFNVGVAHIGDLLPATAVIPAADIPAKGLQTEWMVIRDGADLSSVDSVVTIDQDTADGRTVAFARFALLVPRDEDSVTVSMALTPNAANPRLHVLIFVRQQPYRSFEIALNAADIAEEPSDPYLPLTVERILALASEMNLATPFEWTTPPGELTVWLAGGMANVSATYRPRSAAQVPSTHAHGMTPRLPRQRGRCLPERRRLANAS